tara:strand:- start:163062 stop:164486 length:1425 start_codon:yes stop_codon:yes gene_type:complete
LKNKLKFHGIKCLSGILLLLLLISCKSEPEFSLIDVKVTVASHYQGAEATIIQLTDHYFPRRYSNFQKDSRKDAAAFAEFLAFKHNIPLHVFEETDKWDEFEDFLNTGRGGASVYYPSCFKDYSLAELNSIISEIENVYGRRPTTLSYGCGKTEYTDSLPNYILGGRNSSAPFSKFNQVANTWYGQNCGNDLEVDFSKTKNLINRPAGGRFYSEIQRYGASYEEASLYVIDQVTESINTSGFYTNFMHWHDYYTNKEGDTIEGVKVMPYLFQALEKGIGDNHTAKIDYNEAIEYLYAKEAIDSVYLSKNAESKFKINLIFKKTRPIDYSVIKTPITLIFSKKSIQELGGKAISFESDYGLGVVKDSSNFYVNIPLDLSKESNSVRIDLIDFEENIEVSFQKPNLKRKGNNTIISTTASKFVVFRRKKEAPEYEIEIVDREFNYSKEFQFKGFEEGYDYFCGAINKQRESSLIAF